MGKYNYIHMHTFTSTVHYKISIYHALANHIQCVLPHNLIIHADLRDAAHLLIKWLHNYFLPMYSYCKLTVVRITSIQDSVPDCIYVSI